jgi:hypothetical protein
MGITRSAISSFVAIRDGFEFPRDEIHMHYGALHLGAKRSIVFEEYLARRAGSFIF